MNWENVLPTVTMAAMIAGLLWSLARLFRPMAVEVARDAADRLKADLKANDFHAIDARFDGVDTRLDGVDKRMDRMDRRIKETRTELSARIKETRTELSARIGDLHTDVRDLRSRMEHNQAEILEAIRSGQ